MCVPPAANAPADADAFAFRRLFCYKNGMKKADRLSPSEVEAARGLRLSAMRLQDIEGNPLDAEDVAMFEMFEREAWSHDRRRAYILAQALAPAAE